MIFMLVCSDIIFIKFWLKVVENKKEQMKKTCFILMNTTNKLVGFFLIILLYIE